MCLKYFFLVGGDFGMFCFNFSVSLCEQSMILPRMFYQQYISSDNLMVHDTMDIPVVDSLS